MTKYKVAGTDKFIALATHAMMTDRNRQVDIPELCKVIDPEGIHLCTLTMLHNDVEWRTRWYIKVKDSMEPLEVWLDVSFTDYESLQEVDYYESTVGK